MGRHLHINLDIGNKSCCVTHQALSSNGTGYVKLMIFTAASQVISSVGQAHKQRCAPEPDAAVNLYSMIGLVSPLYL